MYIAKIEIGGYKEGDEVPKEKAEVWKNMYAVSPVEEVLDKDKEIKKDESVEEIVYNKNNFSMHDDYLNRNSKVVVKNLEKDKLSLKELENLLKIEKENKDRSVVIKAINYKIKQDFKEI